MKFVPSQLRIFLIAMTLLVPVAAIAAPPTTQQLIEQLDAPDPAVRDAAESLLTARGKSVVEPLKQAAIDDHAQVRQRATRILRVIRLFQLRGADPALEIADAYLHQPEERLRKPMLTNLAQLKGSNPVLTRLCILETDEGLRKTILYPLGTGYREAIPRLIADDDDLSGVLLLLNEASSMWGHGQAADDAMALSLTGELDDQIAICTAELGNGDPAHQERAAARLCYFHRATGNFAEALKFARISHDQSLIFLVLQDQGDWSAAANEPDDRWGNPQISAAFRSAFQRLAGRPTDAANTMAVLSNVAIPDNDASFSPSRYFLLNDMPARGIELLTDQHPAVAFRMHVLRGEIAAAFDVAGQHTGSSPEAEELRTQCDELRQSLGELPTPPVVPPTTQSAESPTAWQLAVADLRDHKFEKAADQFEAMWSRDHTEAAWLYLQGSALNAAGQAERGQALMHTADVCLLGDAMARWQLSATLDAAGLTEAAEHERDLGLRGGGDYDDPGFTEIYSTRAFNAIDRHDWRTAGEQLDRLCLIHLSTRWNWNDSIRLLTIPALAHLVKARDARDHHDLPALHHELQAYLQYQPFSTEFVIEWTPALDKLGEHALADELFNGLYEKLDTICRKYPKSGPYHNDLAWLSACCGRRLDEALKAAEISVNLTPDHYQVLDTLAEVHFRRGERAAAVEIEKRAMGMTSDPYIARQLKRFQNAAVPSTTQPGPEPQ